MFAFYTRGMVPRPLPDRIAAVTALDDPARRAVFDLVARAGTAVSRDQAAEALGVSRRAAAFHLDRLADQGLLAVEYRRPPGRGGPGAGRPAKLYRRTEDEVAVSVPERHYDLVGGLLAAAVTESIDTGAPVREVLHRTAYDAGKAIGVAAPNLPAAPHRLRRRKGHRGGRPTPARSPGAPGLRATPAGGRKRRPGAGQLPVPPARPAVHGAGVRGEPAAVARRRRRCRRLLLYRRAR